MGANYLNRLGDIPACIPSPESPETSLQAWLRGLNQKANEASGVSDDAFSQEDYQSALKQPWGKSIIQVFHGRPSYAAFSDTIAEYIERSRHSVPCLKSHCRERGAMVQETKEGWSCIENPKKPPRPKPSKAVPSGLSRLDPASKPPWWNPPTPSISTAPSARPPVTVSPYPDLTEVFLRPAWTPKPLSEANQTKLMQMEQSILLTAAQQANKRKGEKSSGIDVIFVIDVSGSMEVNLGHVLKAVPSIVARLKKAAGEVRVGIVRFSDAENIRIILPLTAIQDASRVQGLQDRYSSGGGTEPVGGASLASLKMFDAKPTRKQLVVITDAEGLVDDKTYPQQFSDTVRAAKRAGVALKLFNFGGPS